MTGRATNVVKLRGSSPGTNGRPRVQGAGVHPSVSEPPLLPPPPLAAPGAAWKTLTAIQSVVSFPVLSAQGRIAVFSISLYPQSSAGKTNWIHRLLHFKIAPPVNEPDGTITCIYSSGTQIIRSVTEPAVRTFPFSSALTS